MYSNKREIHALVSLMHQYDVTDVVCCPGSRNAAVVNDMQECGFRLHAITDERSAGFVALGNSLAIGRPVAVCVTSGSALLNLLPAVSEAYYRNIPLFIISADRPLRHIDIWDGQTIHQRDALYPYAETYSIDESDNENGFRWNVLKINQALSKLFSNQLQPVHLNIEIEEPLFDFSVQTISPSKKIKTVFPKVEFPIPNEIIEEINKAKLPVLFIGQYEKEVIEILGKINENQSILLLPEIIVPSPYWIRNTILENVISSDDFQPDLIIHAGGNLVNKQLKNYFRNCKELKVIRIEEKTFCPNTLNHLDTVIYTNNALNQLAEIYHPNAKVKKWIEKFNQIEQKIASYQVTTFSDLYAMQYILGKMSKSWCIHFANSTTIRNATYFKDFSIHKLLANRGTNGIEGSISSAVGYAMGAPDEPVMVMTGDLSFFYDVNALYNVDLPKNLSIIVFNNGGGQIFRRLPGINASQALDKFIAASHSFSAQGVASTYGVKYFSASNPELLKGVINDFITCNGHQAAILEIFTKIEDNESVRKEIEEFIKYTYNNI